MGVPFVTVLRYELKANLNRYLESLGSGAPVRSLEEIIAFNRAHRDVEMPYFGQDVFLAVQEMGPLTEPAYETARAEVRQFSRTEGMDWILDRHGLDALVAPGSRPGWRMVPVQADLPGGGGSSPASVAGYPALTVPMGFVYGMPVGLSFLGRAWSEPTLIRMAYAFEQATKHRRPPTFPAQSDPRLE
jgi:amidase